MAGARSCTLGYPSVWPLGHVSQPYRFSTLGCELVQRGSDLVSLFGLGLIHDQTFAWIVPVGRVPGLQFAAASSLDASAVAIQMSIKQASDFVGGDLQHPVAQLDSGTTSALIACTPYFHTDGLVQIVGIDSAADATQLMAVATVNFSPQAD
jgi:hypothetical protein